MRRHRLAYECLAYTVVVFCTAAATTASAQSQQRAAVELFTSQGCSSCPAADKLLGELAADPALVAISMSIDYWDYLGWKDTLADPHNTARQKAYAHARGDGQVYTPQVVVNGILHVLGSDKAAIERAIAKSRKYGAMSSPPLTLAVADGRVSVAVADGAGPLPHAPAHSASETRVDALMPGEGKAAGAEVWLCGLTKAVTIAIGRGENKGRTVTYHNVLRRWVKVGDWIGKADSWSAPLAELQGDGIDGVVVLVQGGTLQKPRAILGATLAAIR
jgi:hypothetical protein